MTKASALTYIRLQIAIYFSSMISRFLVLLLVVCIFHLSLHPSPVSDDFFKPGACRQGQVAIFCEHIGPYDLMILSRSHYFSCFLYYYSNGTVIVS